jgi:hypothetical protein
VATRGGRRRRTLTEEDVVSLPVLGEREALMPRSSDAVFELSLRFAKPWEQDKSLSPEQALEAKR